MGFPRGALWGLLDNCPAWDSVNYPRIGGAQLVSLPGLSWGGAGRVGVQDCPALRFGVLLPPVPCPARLSWNGLGPLGQGSPRAAVGQMGGSAPPCGDGGSP